jgi:2-alkyl-3-oxoalkanoate reductase
MAGLSPVLVVTGANGLVGAAVCRALVERSAQLLAGTVCGTRLTITVDV